MDRYFGLNCRPNGEKWLIEATGSPIAPSLYYRDLSDARVLDQFDHAIS